MANYAALLVPALGSPDRPRFTSVGGDAPLHDGLEPFFRSDWQRFTKEEYPC